MLEMFPRYVNKKDRIFTWLNDYDSEEKIVIFGDSYAYSENKSFKDKNVEKHFNNKSWFGHLHHKTKKQIWNYGCGGTSLLYSKQQLFGYLNSEDYDENDYIIFVTTSHTRIPSFPNDIIYKPNYQASILGFLNNSIPKTHESYDVFNKNKKVFEWLSYTLSKEDFINELRLLQAFLGSLPNKTLLLPAFEYKDANNFLDVKNFVLSNVSEKENIHDTLFTTKTHPRRMGIDPRKQHMSDKNNEILANMIDNYFKGISSFNLEDFERE